jgi:hypothetical protein
MQPHPEYVRGLAAGRREAVELSAAGLRLRIAEFRAEEAKRGTILAAMLWAVTEGWIARLEAVASELEQQAAGLRAKQAALPPTPARAAKPTKGRRR